MSTPLLDYYAERAHEYERIYFRDDAQRQLEQLQLATAVGETCLGRTVLEIACGTGYWTQFADRTAQQVTALDANPAVLEVAKNKGLSHTEFVMGDAYAPSGGTYTAGMALFWLSHVPRVRLEEWLSAFHSALQPGARVLLADNVFVPGIGGKLTVPDEAGDTHKLRELSDGSTHRILKNYFTAAELRSLFAPYADQLDLHLGQCFWWASYARQ